MNSGLIRLWWIVQPVLNFLLSCCVPLELASQRPASHLPFRHDLMPAEYEIRANYDKDTIVVYQAYAPEIADSAIKQQRFVSPFSFHRMTWIKPSFLWLMYRSNWGQKKGQKKTLAVHISRNGWDKALSLGVLTHPEPAIFPNSSDWESRFRNAHVHIQWDTERSLRGAGLNGFSIQVGISRHLIHEYVDDWIVKIEDLTPTVTKIRGLIKAGKEKQARRHLPHERVYPVAPDIGKSIHLKTSLAKWVQAAE